MGQSDALKINIASVQRYTNELLKKNMTSRLMDLYSENAPFLYFWKNNAM